MKKKKALVIGEADSRKDQSKTIGKRVIPIKRYGTKEQGSL